MGSDGQLAEQLYKGNNPVNWVKLMVQFLVCDQIHK